MMRIVYKLRRTHHNGEIPLEKTDSGRLKIHSQVHRDFVLLGQSKILRVGSLEAQHAVFLCLLSLLPHKTSD